MVGLCQDVLQGIIILVVDACDEGYPILAHNDGEPPHPESSSPSEALVTLIRLSHVNHEWRSLTLLVSRLWARHLRITQNMSPALFEEIAARTGDQPIHLRVIDIAFQSRIWLATSRLFKRCVYLSFLRRHRTDFMEFIYTTPAPVLARCDLISENRAPAIIVWKPLFSGKAPSLRTLRLVRTGVDCSSERPRIPDMPHIGLQSLAVITGLVQLELNFPTNIAKYSSSPSPFAGKPSCILAHIQHLKLTGNPFIIAHLLDAVELPALATISVAYTFSPESVFQALSAIWQPLFRHFPSIDFPTFGIGSHETNFEFRLLHSSGRSIKIQFDDKWLLNGIHTAERAFAEPFIHLPLDQCDRVQLLHGMAWMALVSIPGFGASVKIVTIAASSRNSMFPYHAHLLLSAMVEVSTLQFDDQASAFHPGWYELLRDRTSLFGYPPLPSISTIIYPAPLLDSILSNVGLHDLILDRRRDSPVLRLHFVSSPSDRISSFTSSTSIALTEVAQVLRVDVSYELVHRKS